MRMHAEAEMRDRVRIEIILAALVAVKPMGKGLGVDAAFDLADGPSRISSRTGCSIMRYKAG